MTSRRPHRITNRRRDPLKARDAETWQREFSTAFLLHQREAVLIASRRVYWDYNASKPVTDVFIPEYRKLTRNPPRENVRAVLITLGYLPVFAERALATYYEGAEINTHLKLRRESERINALDDELDRQHGLGS